MERYRTQASYMELRDIEVDSIPPSVTNPVIQDIRTEYTRTKSEYDRKKEMYGESYPDMLQLRAKLDSLKRELEKVVSDAESEYRAALRNENYLRDSVENQRTEVARMSSDAILYNSLKIEVENKRKLLNSLVERQTETQVSSNLEKFKASNISIIDRGEVPQRPVSPNKKLNFLFALLIGLSGGAGLCILLEQLDNTMKGNEDLEKLFGISALGAIPLVSSDGVKKGKMHGYYSGYRSGYGDNNLSMSGSLPELKEIELVNYHFPQLSISEDYRTVRTSILLSHAENPPKVIVFTSAMSQEGKTTTVANMAASFAQLDQRVLIIDADLRKPRLHKIFEVENTAGLSGFLTGKHFIRNAIIKTNIDNIWILPSGLIPPNPAELLNSKKMTEMISVVKKGYDVILIDTPPVLAVIDPVVVSTLADSTVLVVKSGKTTYKMLSKAIEEMNRSNTHIIGVLFNELNVGRGDYRYMDYYSYRDYSYKSESEDEKVEDIDI
jgi:capsular exopolysaccharide synthesis family protein